MVATACGRHKTCCNGFESTCFFTVPQAGIKNCNRLFAPHGTGSTTGVCPSLFSTYLPIAVTRLYDLTMASGGIKRPLSLTSTGQKHHKRKNQRTEPLDADITPTCDGDDAADAGSLSATLQRSGVLAPADRSNVHQTVTNFPAQRSASLTDESGGPSHLRETVRVSVSRPIFQAMT